MAAQVDLVLLDLDGTLTDSAPGILACLAYALDDMDIPLPDEGTLRSFLGPPLAQTFGGHFGMDDRQVSHAIAKYRERYHDIGLFESEVYDGIPALLDALDAAGLTLAVATSKPTYSATRILQHFGLDEHLAFIGGADLAGERHDKAAVIAHTLEQLEATGHPVEPGRTLMAGDRHHDVHGAAAHGIDTIGVLWGYGDAAELSGAGAVALALDPAELCRLLLASRAEQGG